MYALMDTLQVEPNFLFQDCVNLASLKNTPTLGVEDENLKELKEIYNSLNEVGKMQLMTQAKQIANFSEYHSPPRHPSTHRKCYSSIF